MTPIRHIRVSILGLTQQAFARAVGVVQPTVSRWETGDTSPSLDDVNRMRGAFPEVPLAAFFPPNPQKEEAA